MITITKSATVNELSVSTTVSADDAATAIDAFRQVYERTREADRADLMREDASAASGSD